MSEQIPAASAPETPAPVTNTVKIAQDVMTDLLSRADVTAVYGKPVKHADTIIISTAEVFALGGFGFGDGNGPVTTPGEPAPGGSGGGGGGRTFARPVAVIIAGPDGVRVEPIVDKTKLGLTALTAAGFMLFTVSRMMRPPRR